MHRRAVALAVPATAIALTVSSCGSIPEDWRTPAFLRMGEDEVDERLPAVSGEVGEKPEVTFPDMEPPDEEVSGVVHEGPGEEGLVRDDDLVVANFAQYEWSGPGEGEELDPDQASYETGAPDLIRMEEMPDELAAPMISQSVGSRVVYVMPPLSEEERTQAESMGQEVPEGATVLVLDLMDRYSSGSVVPGEAAEDVGDDLPTVVQDGHSEPEIDVPDTDPPEDLSVEHLIEGQGEEVEEGQQVIVQYTGVPWEPDEEGRNEVFDSSWSQGGVPFDTTIGSGAVIEGWDEGMVGQPVGSRLLMTVPPDLAYGEEDTGMGTPTGTLVFVVDILGAVENPPQPDPEDMPEEMPEGMPEGGGEISPEDLEGLEGMPEGE